jgi:hypothetical protein
MSGWPMDFTGPMMKAILEGRKTQTRRPMNPQPREGDFVRCPYGQIGDRLWVRETWAEYVDHKRIVRYRADCEVDGAYYPCKHVPGAPEAVKWRSPIHMARRDSRLTLEIMATWYGCIQEIPPDDALAEGIDYEQHGAGLGDPCDEVRMLHAFQALWDGIYEKKGFGWYENPWVWVVEFERVL